MTDDQKEIWEAHELADGHWVTFEGDRHFWPLYEDTTLCGHVVEPGVDPPGTLDLPLCGACHKVGLAKGIHINWGVHVTIEPPDVPEPPASQENES